MDWRKTNNSITHLANARFALGTAMLREERNDKNPDVEQFSRKE